MPKARESLYKENSECDFTDFVLASNGFFPFADSIVETANAGIKNII